VISNHYKATLMLIGVTTGFFCSYPYSHTFLGGLIASGSSAAMVGGLADWFAVSALFRRPLGIPFRTEIIPRNRRRLEQAIVEMVENELLTSENIRELLNHHDIVEILVRYLDKYGGKEEIKKLGKKLSDEIMVQIDIEQVAAVLSRLVKENADRIRLAEPLAAIMIWSIDKGYFDSLVEFVLDELIRVSGEPEIKALFGTMFEEAKKAYERDLQQRQFVGRIVEGMGLTRLSVGAVIAEKLAALIGELKFVQHPARVRLRQNAVLLAKKLANDEIPAKQVEAWKNKLFDMLLDLPEKISKIMRSLQAGLTTGAGKYFLHARIDGEVDKAVAKLYYRQGDQAYLSEMLKQAVLMIVETKHNQIGVIVRERLEQFSTKELVGFIEARVGSELAIIRINGSVVGGLVGMIIYLTGFWW